MVFKSTVYFISLMAIFGECQKSEFAGPAKQVLEVISGLTQVNKVVVENLASAQIYLKCASKDDVIDWHTLERNDVSMLFSLWHLFLGCWLVFPQFGWW